MGGATLTGVKSGPLVGSAPISLPSYYNFVSGTNEQWIVGPNVDLSGADLRGMDLSGAHLNGVDLSGAKSGPLVGSAPISLPSGYKFVSGTKEIGLLDQVLILMVQIWWYGIKWYEFGGADLSGATLTGENQVWLVRHHHPCHLVISLYLEQMSNGLLDQVLI